MIQFIAAAVFLLVGGTSWVSCSGKKITRSEKPENSNDSFALNPEKAGDIQWASARVQNYCKRFSQVNLNYICSPRPDGQKPYSCYRNETHFATIAEDWNRLEQYDKMAVAACFGLRTDDPNFTRYKLLAASLNNQPGEKTHEKLADTLAASEKGLSLLETDFQLIKLTAITNGRMGDQLIKEGKETEAISFYTRGVNLYEKISKKWDEDDLNNLLGFYNHLISFFLKKDDFEKTKRYFNDVFTLMALRSSEIKLNIQSLDQFVELYRTALKKKNPPLILNENEANWETIGRIYHQLAKSENDCKKAEIVMVKAREAFKLTGKKKQYSNLTKSTCNPHN